MKSLALFLLGFAIMTNPSSGCGKSLEAYIQEAQELEQSGNIEKAIETLEEAVTIFPEEPEGHAYLGLYLGMQAGRTADFMEAGRLVSRAFGALDKAISLDSRNPLARFNRGVLGLEVPDFLGKLDGGIEDLEFFVKLSQEDPDEISREQLASAHEFLGTGYERRGEGEKARRAWETVAELVPGTPMAERAEASVQRLSEERQMTQKRAPETPEIVALQEKVERKPEDPTLLVELGKAYFDAGNYEQARETFKKAMSLDPTNREAVTSLVMTIGRMSQGYDERIYENTEYRMNLAFELMDALDKAVALSPEDGQMRLMRGIMGVQMPFFVQRLDQGIEDLQKVLESDVPDSAKANALYWLGAAHQKKGMTYWIQVVSNYPSSPESQLVFDDMRPDVERFDLSEHRTPLVAIDFILGFRDELAPQAAVWIEDEKGTFVRSIYVSGFSGFVKERQIVLPQWASSSNFVDVDAITEASIDVGHHIYVWDLRDNSGKKVKKGNYVVKVESHWWPTMEYQVVSAPVVVGKKESRVVIKEGNLVPYLEVTYVPK